MMKMTYTIQNTDFGREPWDCTYTYTVYDMTQMSEVDVNFEDS